jgi:alkylresorcinol/alkylpyrone synthase
MLVDQEEALRFILKRFRMRPATRELYKKVFANASIAQRRFSLDRLEEVLEENPDLVNRRFERESVDLSRQSLDAALRRAGLHPRELDFLAVSTCTGYLCPGISARLVEACGLRKDVRYADLVGMGCGGAIPALEQARNFAAAHPGALAAVVATEICSAAMFSDDAADLVVSNALFADGSAAALLRHDRRSGGLVVRDFASRTYPAWRDQLRFILEQGRLRNVLDREVPRHAGESVRETVGLLLKRNKISIKSVNQWALHPGGAKVLDAVQSGLLLEDPSVRDSREILRKYGNLSSPSVLYVLERKLALRRFHPGDFGVLAAFGAGFSVHSALVEFE